VNLLDSKVAVVTGAARGIGLAIAERFVAEGATVVLVDVLDEEVESAASSLKGGRAIPCVADVSDEVSVKVLFEGIERDYGGADILVNNAAVVDIGPVLDKPLSEFDRVLAINTRGVFLCSQQAAIQMKTAGGGAIVNITSVGAWLTDDYTAAYAASKGAVESITRAFAQPLGPFGIRVNAVAPGIVETAMNHDQFTDADRSEAIEHIAMRRLGEPADIAAAVLFLASDDSQWITATTLVVDGGLTSHFGPRFAHNLPADKAAQ
jgi:cyclopentanol dehydrogenase